jgi:serine/threonine protein phosphatase PrpC
MSVLFSFANPATDRGMASYNQDRASTNEKLLVVADGHGTYGEEIAIETVQQINEASSDMPLEAIFAVANETCYNVQKNTMIAKGVQFEEHGKAFYSGYHMTPITGGTTATVVKLDPESGAMTCAHVGDSEARYYDIDNDDGVSMCSDHTPTSKEEFLRIREKHPYTEFIYSGGATPLPIWYPTFTEGWKMVPRGVQNCDVRGGWSSYVKPYNSNNWLAMTRAIGDFDLQKNGVSPIPSVATFSPPVQNVIRAVVVASDGLWDAVHYKEVCDIVRRNDLLGNADAATKALLEFGIAKSKERFGGHACHDNITVVVSYVKLPEPVVVPEPVVDIVSEPVEEIVEPVALPDAPDFLLMPELPVQGPYYPTHYYNLPFENPRGRVQYYNPRCWNNNFGRGRGRYAGSGRGRGNF